MHAPGDFREALHTRSQILILIQSIGTGGTVLVGGGILMLAAGAAAVSSHVRNAHGYSPSKPVKRE